MYNSKEFFRKKPLEKIAKPSQLNEYIKVSSPSIWTVLIAAMVFLLGLGFWSVFGTIESGVDALAVVTDGNVTIYIHPENINEVKAGMTVRINNAQGVIKANPAAPEQISKGFNQTAMEVGELMVGDWIIPLKAELSLPDGAYKVKIITETLQPISFLIQ